MNFLIQSWLLITSVIAITCISSNDNKIQLRGFISGLLSEFAWIYLAWVSGQWSVVILALYWLVFYFIGMMRRL